MPAAAIRKFGLAIAAIAALGSCTPAVPQKVAPVHIRLGTYEWPGSYWIDVAAGKGWFAEAGLDVETIDTDRRYFESLDAVAAGKLDAMGFSQFDLVRYVASGHDLVGVAAIDYSEGAEALVARANIKTLHDLRGKRLALSRGTYLEYLLSVFAEREGFDLSEVTLVDRSQEDALADFEGGRVEAALLWEPYTTQAQTAVGGVRLFSTAEFPGLTYSVFSMRREFLKMHPAEVQAMLGVWQRAVQFIREHPQESCQLVSRSLHEPAAEICDLMRTDRILDRADNGRAFSYAAGFESLHGSWRRMNDFMMERGLVARRIDSPAHLDSRFVRALD